MLKTQHYKTFPFSKISPSKKGKKKKKSPILGHGTIIQKLETLINSRISFGVVVRQPFRRLGIIRYDNHVETHNNTFHNLCCLRFPL